MNVDLSPSQLTELCEALDWQGGTYHEVLGEVKRLRAFNKKLISALSELHAQVRGECPSLLNEDSGGDGKLAIKIEDLLETAADWEGIKRS